MVHNEHRTRKGVCSPLPASPINISERTRLSVRGVSSAQAWENKPLKGDLGDFAVPLLPLVLLMLDCCLNPKEYYCTKYSAASAGKV